MFSDFNRQMMREEKDRRELAIATVLAVFLTIASIAGCATAKEVGSDEKDFSEFFFTHAVKCGARPLTTNVPPLLMRWQLEEDENGFQVKTERKNFRPIEAFLGRAFGSPRIPVRRGRDGFQMGVYATRDVGVAIQFGLDRTNAFITLVRGLSLNEIYGGMIKVLNSESARSQSEKK